MVIDNEKAIEILTCIQEYCKDKTRCNECLLGRDECDALFDKEKISSGWEVNLKAPKKKNNTEKGAW